MCDMKKKLNDGLALILLAMISFGFGGIIIVNGQTPTEDPPAKTITNDNYKIGPGDLLDIVVVRNDQLSRTGVRVSNTGTIQIPMNDTDIPAACLTERQLADAIKDKYKKYILDPYVNVSVREFNSNPVAVIGAVNSPGRFQLQRTIRLAELLAFVNGTSSNAGVTAEIIRDTGRPYCQESTLVVPSGGGEDLISVSLLHAFKGGDKANPVIMAGDIVRVAAADQINAYIQGNVRNSMAISLKDPVTLTQAVAMAGGTTQGAQLEKVIIRRQMPGSVNRDPILVNVKEINQKKRDDVLLQSNDIVEIPGPTGITKFFQQTFLPIVTQLPMRVIP